MHSWGNLSVKFAFIIDPIHQLNPCHDTSVAFMEAAGELGHEVWITEIKHLSVVESKAWATIQQVHLTPVQLQQGKWIAANPWYVLGDRVFKPLEAMDAVFMRTDPPVNVPYLYSTYILDYVDPTKTLVVNAPKGLRAANEKMYALQFTQVIPETIVSQEKSVIREFVHKQGAAILKPLGGKAGEGILYLEAGDRNLNSLMEISTRGSDPVMVQTYLPEAKAGDKRIILLDGEPIGAVNRLSAGNEFRNNMAVGGNVAPAEITPQDQRLCSELAPKLRADGLWFVGIDIIGNYLTEVNVTSPTCVREIDLFNGTRLGHNVIEWVVKTLTQRKE